MLFDLIFYYFFFFKQKTAYEMRISDWSSDVCSSDLGLPARALLSFPSLLFLAWRDRPGAEDARSRSTARSWRERRPGRKAQAPKRSHATDGASFCVDRKSVV